MCITFLDNFLSTDRQKNGGTDVHGDSGIPPLLSIEKRGYNKQSGIQLLTFTEYLISKCILEML